jgi:hypothetical protein
MKLAPRSASIPVATARLVSENQARVMLRKSMIGNLASLAENAPDSWERENTSLRPSRSCSATYILARQIKPPLLPCDEVAVVII